MSTVLSVLMVTNSCLASTASFFQLYMNSDSKVQFRIAYSVAG